MNTVSTREFRVIKSEPSKIFFSNSHVERKYRSIILKRKATSMLLKGNISQLNEGPNKLSAKNVEDLMALCSGDHPPIRLPDHAQFYRSLPH